ncbi:2,3-bisphosphoglycerate-independent phosphoglycerate mutase [Pseudodesulfovibrio hydrargyri]|uniref:2,3-bisphosphoglycerate-independent phosphoglycerate mutase n=1 Tax=Pseudodesulfovibrio hydrargyri TaxID=2125990 RepID=A0A1J5NHI2_9BACT|nr:alkaline phosphatase family protein [Pseudodesulfovibrio hydrargyri]OIQ51153.1 2,3-bisphosphoglycerate-independent phosphoglycerate mutase [Pseudodesulfovibrio hydrargyri]
MPDTCILILLDGLGDRSHPGLGDRTPLQAAATPCLDRLASVSATGLYHATRFGRPLPSENAHFALFGGLPEEFPGRGALEALGAGVELGTDDVALLTHFAHIGPDADNRLTLLHDKVPASPGEAEALFAALPPFLFEGVTGSVHPVGGLFGVLVLRGEVSPFVTDTNPMVDGRLLPRPLPLKGHEDTAARRTARALEDYLVRTHRTLSALPLNREREKAGQIPANGLVTQRAGRLTRCPTMRQRYGLRGLSIATGAMYAGLARFAGMDFLKARDTDDPGADLAERIRLALDRKDDYDFIHVHTKRPDQAAHSKNPEAKVRVIESLDRGLGEVADGILADPRLLLAVTADHSTPSCGALIHSGEPVPLMFAGRGVRRDAVAAFDEVAVAGGALGCMRGREFLFTVLNYLDRARLAGIHDSPDPVEYWPGDHPPFILDPQE